MKEEALMHIPLPQFYDINSMKEDAEEILDVTTKAVKKMKKNSWFSAEDAADLRRFTIFPGPVCLVSFDNKSTVDSTRVDLVYGKEPPLFAMIANRMQDEGTISLYTLTRSSTCPANVLPQGNGYFYVLSWWGYHGGNYIRGDDYAVNVDNKGVITPAKYISRTVSYLGKRRRRVPSQQVVCFDKMYRAAELHIDKDVSLSDTVAIVFNIYSKVAYGWEAQFAKQDGEYRGQVRFAFQLDVAKKIFRERENRKTTPTGRLSPIAHFVKSHYREQKPRTLWQMFQYFILGKRSFSTVKTHVRGAKEFYMDNLLVKIKESNLDKDMNPKMISDNSMKDVRIEEDLTVPVTSAKHKDHYVYHAHAKAA